MAALTWKLLFLILTYSVYLIGTVEGKSCTYYKAYSYLSYSYVYRSSVLKYRQSAGTTKSCSSCCYSDCCTKYYLISSYSSAITAGAIAGILIGCLVAIAVIVSLIVVCCMCVRRNQRQPGQIVRTRGQPISYINSNQQGSSGQVIAGGDLTQQNPQALYPHAGSNSTYAYPPVDVGTANTVNPNLVGTSNVGYTPETAVPPPQYETKKQ